MQIENLGLSFGTQIVFKNINLIIPKNEKVGVVGLNGAGKTTLFNLILNNISPDSGKITMAKNIRIELLPQVIEDVVLDSDIIVMDYLLSGRPIKELESKLEKLYLNVSLEKSELKLNQLYKRISNTEAKLEYFDSYNAQGELLKIVDKMGISADILEQRLNTLSGGQKSKVSFARLLYAKPEILLLDEPTNHLDAKSKDFVINYLKNYESSVYVISHDVDFLNQIITKTLFINKQTKNMELYSGNYDLFLKVSKQRHENLVNQANIQANTELKLKKYLQTHQGMAHRSEKLARSYEDRKKKLIRLQENKIEIASPLKSVNMKMEVNRDSYLIPLKVENLCFKYDKMNSQNIIDNLTFDLKRGEKFLIVGENGVGKSTLLKLIISELIPDNGTITLTDKTDIAYYAQEHELLNTSLNIIDNFKDIDLSLSKIRAVLGNFLFHGDDVYKKVSVLSPGERSRVALAKLSLSKANFLILDEPTNHLDPQTQKIIAKVFKTFPGTMLVVSHNPEFVDYLGIERTLILPSGELSYYERKIVQHYSKINEKK